MQVGSRTKGLQAAKRRTTLLPTPCNGTATCASAMSITTTTSSEDADQPDRWDLGVEVLLQGKALEAAERQRKHAAAAASSFASSQVRLPHCAASKLQQQPQLCCGVSGSTVTGENSPLVSHISSSAAGGSAAALQHQESSCSSRSRSSFVGSVASYQQQREAAQHQAQLLSSAPLGELQACRMWAMLRQWEELRELLSQ
jgi:hypothetical protein